ncbi:glycosyltransferase family 4 protein [Agromyces salentinus]|uniref:Glycogen synthase n=1 Tax=Agromyces salentinus TaxID=269421 RepID=A0ABN2MWW1_9MICO|nr:glycosyltransferase family 4 protein [Agromyces salentinus]
MSAATAASTASRPIVHHLGRGGEVAGGMTQVVNGYLEWPFEHVDTRVIVTRGDPGDSVAAARLAARAAVQISGMRRSTPQVIVGHLSEGGSFLREGSLLRMAKARGIPTIAHLHGSSFAEFADRRPGVVGGVLRASDRVISLSEESSEVAARFVERERIELVPNAIAGSLPSAKQPIVAFGGVVGYRKGIDVLQRAWADLGAAKRGWRLVIAGPIRDEHLVDRDAEGVEFVGSLPHDELMTLLDTSLVAVLPSREEAMPMFILEALARRCCVISTDVGGIEAVLRDGAGVVVPPGDADALAAALRSVLGDPERLDAIAAEGSRVFEERFSASAVFPRVESLWLDAINGRRTRSLVSGSTAV